MSDFASFMKKPVRTIFENDFFDDFVHKELIPLSHLKEKHSSLILEMDLPLVDKKNIEIISSREYLIIKAKLTKTFCISRGSTMTEFDYFKKTIRLPNNANTKQISAKFKNGILRIIIPKIVIGKKIPIE